MEPMPPKTTVRHTLPRLDLLRLEERPRVVEKLLRNLHESEVLETVTVEMTAF